MLKRIVSQAREQRLLTLAGLCLFLLLAAALLPLAFRQPASTEGSAVPGSASDAREKAKLFAAYWANGGQGSSESYTVTGIEPPETTAAYCEALMEGLAERCLYDMAVERSEPSGAEYLLLQDPAGCELTLCRMWIQSSGDWQNWLDACFDAETGILYSLYVSRECLGSLSNYVNMRRYDAAGVAALAAEVSGAALRTFLPGADREGTAIVDAADGVWCYQISCTDYDKLVDFRLTSV